MAGAPRCAAKPLWRLWGSVWLWALLGAVGEDVLTLTGETFEAVVKANPLILVKFHAPWCGHCRRLAPEFEKAASILKGRVPLAKVDATVETTLAEQYRVEGYPTFYFFRRGVPEEYSGGRQTEGIVQWVEEQMGPAVKPLKSDIELSAALEQRGFKLYIVAKGDQALVELFKKLASEHRTFGSYYQMESTAPPLVEVYRGADEVKQLTGEDVKDAAKVLAFIQSELLPPFGEINEDNYEPYLARSEQGIIWACFHPDSFRADAARHMATFKEVAETFAHFPVVYTDTKEYEEHVKEELGCTDFPMLVVQIGNLTAGHDAKRYRKILLEEEINGKALTSWIQAVLDGTVDEDDGLEDLDEDDYDEVAEDDASAGAGGDASAGAGGSASRSDL